MGLSPNWSVSSYDPLESRRSVNPDPKKYKVLQNIAVGHNLVVKLQYEDCTNYEGVKILVFLNCTIEQLLKQAEGIDPHFASDNKYLSPFARFEPTELGFVAACAIAYAMESANPTIQESTILTQQYVGMSRKE